jgi:hypothetical protein
MLLPTWDSILRAATSGLQQHHAKQAAPQVSGRRIASEDACPVTESFGLTAFAGKRTREASEKRR